MFITKVYVIFIVHRQLLVFLDFIPKVFLICSKLSFASFVFKTTFELSKNLTPEMKANFASSFQYTAIKTLVQKVLKAYEEFKPQSVVIAGGVAANQELRKQLKQQLSIPINYAPIELCTDNAAMIATLGYYMTQSCDPVDPYSLEVKPSISMSQTSWSN